VTARLVVQVQPRARRSEVAGRYGDAVKIRLAAPPVDGAANEELIRFVAELLKVPKSAVTITAGLTARRKTVQIDGVPPDAVNEIAS
jgi:uncharacterized protein (TIGR00251 family)